MSQQGDADDGRSEADSQGGESAEVAVGAGGLGGGVGAGGEVGDGDDGLLPGATHLEVETYLGLHVGADYLQLLNTTYPVALGGFSGRVSELCWATTALVNVSGGDSVSDLALADASINERRKVLCTLHPCYPGFVAYHDAFFDNCVGAYALPPGHDAGFRKRAAALVRNIMCRVYKQHYGADTPAYVAQLAPGVGPHAGDPDAVAVALFQKATAGGSFQAIAEKNKLSRVTLNKALNLFQRKTGLLFKAKHVVSSTPAYYIVQALTATGGPTIPVASKTQPYNVHPWDDHKGTEVKEKVDSGYATDQGWHSNDTTLTDFAATCSMHELVASVELWFRSHHVFYMLVLNQAEWITLGVWPAYVDLLRDACLPDRGHNAASLLELMRPNFRNAVETLNASVGSLVPRTFDSVFREACSSLERELLQFSATSASQRALRASGGGSAGTPPRAASSSPPDKNTKRVADLQRELQREIASFKRQRGGSSSSSSNRRGRGSSSRSPAPAGPAAASTAVTEPRPDREGRKRGGLDSSSYGECKQPDCNNSKMCNRSHAQKADYVPEANR